MRLHLYEQGTELPTTLDVDASDSLLDVIDIDDGDLIAWVQDEAVADDHDDFGDEAVEPIAADVSVALADVMTGKSSIAAIRNPLKKVRVEVTYSGTSLDFNVSGAALVRKVRRRAIRKFHIDATTAADLTLRLAGHDEDLDLKRPIGAYVPKGTTSIDLDLVPIVRPQG